MPKCAANLERVNVRVVMVLSDMSKNGSVPEEGVFWSVSKLLVKQNTKIAHENFV